MKVESLLGYVKVMLCCYVLTLVSILWFATLISLVAKANQTLYLWIFFWCVETYFPVFTVSFSLRRTFLILPGFFSLRKSLVYGNEISFTNSEFLENNMLCTVNAWLKIYLNANFEEPFESLWRTKQFAVSGDVANLLHRLIFVKNMKIFDQNGCDG